MKYTRYEQSTSGGVNFLTISIFISYISISEFIYVSKYSFNLLLIFFISMFF